MKFTCHDGATTTLKNYIKKMKSPDNFYVFQMGDLCGFDYKPKYPEKTAADFTVYFSYKKGIEMVGNLYSLIPTIKKYKSEKELFKDLYEMGF